MNLATVVSICASVIQLGIAAVMVAMTRAAGWRRARLFVGIALSAGLYSALDVAFSVQTIGDTTRVAALRASYAVAGIHCAAWLVYVFGEPGKRRWGLGPRITALGIVTMLLGLSALIPGLVVSSSKFRDVSVEALGVHYRTPGSTLFGDFVALWFPAVLLVPYVMFARQSSRGDRAATARLLAFSLFFACVVNEALVTSGIYDFLYLAEVGFMAIVLVVVIENAERVMRDAQTLHVLSRSLDNEARTRTQERDDARGALVRAERAAAFGRLARGAGEEIDNPLTCVHTNIEYVRDQLGGSGASEELVHALDDAVDGTLQIRSIIAELQAYAHDRDGQRRRVSLTKVVHSALQLVAPEMHRVARVVEEFAPMPLVMADRLRLLQVFVNLFSNSVQALRSSVRPGERVVTIRTRTTAAGEACAEISDTGDGILPEDLRRVAEPFFTTRNKEGRAGLGLFIARSIVEAHGGRLEIESDKARGTMARVVLPNGEVEDTPTPISPPESESLDEELGDRARFLSLRAGSPSYRGAD